tara:strand:- start:26 stop:292 length:267 start_codon:yes stop_codon:yes gene_type:complete
MTAAKIPKSAKAGYEWETLCPPPTDTSTLYAEKANITHMIKEKVPDIKGSISVREDIDIPLAIIANSPMIQKDNTSIRLLSPTLLMHL